MRRLTCLIALIVLALPPVVMAQTKDTTPRIAVITAFPPEIAVLSARLEDRSETVINGVIFLSGILAGKQVVLFMSGVSMVNAAMSSQLALDHFNIDRIVFSGVAGGVDPNLDVGDVVVAEQWGQYLEVTMARQTDKGFAFSDSDRPPSPYPNLGFMFPNAVAVPRGHDKPDRRFWFPADPKMLTVARTVADKVTLDRCRAKVCLLKAPKVVVGGNGVSGAAFVDNKEVREWAYQAFQARVLDMETAAVSQVAFANDTPFIAFRSLSDLAGGDPGKNQSTAFYPLASDNSAAVVLEFLKQLQ